MIHEIVKKSSQYFLWMLLAKMTSTAAFLIFGRILGAQEFGQFLYWLTIIQVVTVFADVGTTHWQQTQATHALAFASALRVRLATYCVSALLFSLGALLASTVSAPMIVLMLIALFSDALLAVSDGYYLASGKGHVLSWKVLSKTLVTLSLFAVFGELTATYALLAYILGNMVTVTWSLPWSIAFGKRAGTSILTTFRQARPYALLIVTSFAYARADALLIGRLVGTAALGNYGAAYRYLEGVSMLPTAIGQVLFPLSAQGKQIDGKTFRPLVVVSASIGVLVGGTVLMLSNLLTVWLLGESYLLAESILRVFALVSVLFFINAPLATLIQSSKRVSEFLPYGIANTLCNILLNLYMIPRFGALGAAYSMLATEVTGMLINLLFIRKLIASS